MREITAGQAFAAPIIENADQIYMIDCNDVQVVATALEAEDTTDQYITVWGAKYNKATFINALKSLGVNVKSNATDETVIKAVNNLDVEAETKLKALVETAKA